MIGTFHFCTASLEFCTACEMALGIRNYFANPLGFRTMCQMVLDVRNFSHALQKFHKVCKMSSQGVFIFAQCAKFLHPMRNDS